MTWLHANLTMKRGVILLVLLAVILLLAVIETRPQVTLEAGDLQGDPEHNTYQVEFFEEGQHTRVASAYLRIDPAADGLSHLFLQFWHSSESQIRSIALDFQGSQAVPDLSLRPPGYDSWPAFQFYPRGERSVSFQVPNLGFVGSGTVNLEFFLDAKSAPAQNLSIQIRMAIHPDSSILARDRYAAARIILEPENFASLEETQTPGTAATPTPVPTLPTPSGTPFPTPQAGESALFLPPCDPAGGQAQIPAALPSDFQAGWNEYLNAAYHFSFSFPPDWDLVEGPHYLCLNPPANPNLRLIIGFKSVAEEVAIQRSGVGAGDISAEGSLNFLGGEVSRDVLSYQGKDKAVLYNQGAEIQAGETFFSLSLDDFRSDYAAAEIPAEVQALVDQIVESFALEANTLSPTGTATPFASRSIGEPEIVFTVHNDQPYSGRAGDPRPDWLAWGAPALAVAPDGSFWIADSAAAPPRLLHYSPLGELLRSVSLEGRIAGLADVEVDQAHLWALGVAPLPPRVLQFAPDGTYQASFDLPEGLRPDGLSGIALAKNGALLVEKGGGALLYQLIDPSGRTDLQPLRGYSFKGFLYGVINDHLSPSGQPLESTVLQPDHTFAGLWIIGVAQDTSFYVAVSEMALGAVVNVDRFVQHFKTSGDRLGVARLSQTEMYTEGDLALGPEGQVYFLASQPDHSVQIQRLRFAPWPIPSQAEAATPTASPTPLTPLLPAWETPPAGTPDLEIARQALLRFFAYLDESRYAEAAELFSGSYADLPVVRDDLPPTSEDKALVWESECLLLRCHLLVSKVIESKQVSPDEFVFVIEFMDVDGTLFVLGPCCGASEAEMPPVWQFSYTVKKVGGQFKVMEPPAYVP